MAIADVLILLAAAVDIVVTTYLLVSYLRHRAITAEETA